MSAYRRYRQTYKKQAKTQHNRAQLKDRNIHTHTTHKDNETHEIKVKAKHK